MLKLFKIKKENENLKKQLLRIIREKYEVEEKLDELVGRVIELNQTVDKITYEFDKLKGDNNV